MTEGQDVHDAVEIDGAVEVEWRGSRKRIPYSDVTGWREVAGSSPGQRVVDTLDGPVYTLSSWASVAGVVLAIARRDRNARSRQRHL